MNEHVTRCTCLRKWDKINTASMQTSTFIKINQKVVEILELWIQHEWEWAVRTCRSVIASQGAASRAQGTTLQYWVKGTTQPYVPHICNFLQQKLPRGPHCNIESKHPLCSIAMSTRRFRYSGFFTWFMFLWSRHGHLRSLNRSSSCWRHSQIGG